MPIVEKILKSKERLSHEQVINLTSDVYNSISILKKRKKDRAFLLTIPVMIVSANESFFKETFSNLIQSSEKYLTNSKHLIKRNNVKFEIEDYYNISKSKFTLGDLIAFSFKYSSIESLYKTFVELSEIDVFENVEELTKLIEEGFELEEFVNKERPIDRNRIFKNLKEVYEIRNIICHDFLSTNHKLKLEPQKLEEYLKDTYLLQELISIICSEKIYSSMIPNSFEGQVEYYNKVLVEKEALLQTYYQQFFNYLETDKQKKNLLNSNKAFEKYLDLDSKYLTSYFSDLDASLLPFEAARIAHKIKLIEQRIKNIEDEIEEMYSS